MCHDAEFLCAIAALTPRCHNRLTSLKLYNSSPLEISRAPKGKDRLPTIIFQGGTVKLREGTAKTAVFRGHNGATRTSGAGLLAKDLPDHFRCYNNNRITSAGCGGLWIITLKMYFKSKAPHRLIDQNHKI